MEAWLQPPNAVPFLQALTAGLAEHESHLICSSAVIHLPTVVFVDMGKGT